MTEALGEPAGSKCVSWDSLFGYSEDEIQTFYFAAAAGLGFALPHVRRCEYTRLASQCVHSYCMLCIANTAVYTAIDCTLCIVSFHTITRYVVLNI